MHSNLFLNAGEYKPTIIRLWEMTSPDSVSKLREREVRRSRNANESLAELNDIILNFIACSTPCTYIGTTHLNQLRKYKPMERPALPYAFSETVVNIFTNTDTS